MANHKSAEKRARQTIKRAGRNRSIRSHVQGAVRAFREALASGDMNRTAEELAKATRSLRQAATKGVLHARTASRRVSRLALAFNSAKK